MWCYDFYVSKQEQLCTMKTLHAKEVLSKTFSVACFATDVIFQMFICRGGNNREKILF